MVRTAFRKIDIRQSEPGRLPEAQAGAVQKEKQGAECRRVQLDRAPPAGLHGRGIEEAAQFVARVDVGRRPTGDLGSLSGIGERVAWPRLIA